MGVEVKTNNAPRPLIAWHELTDSERREFDWIESPEETGADFFRYRGNVYCVSEFMRVPEKSDALDNWDGYAADSYFSGTVIKLSEDGESVIAGRYYS